MTRDDSIDHDLDRLVARLPEILRDDWVVIPKRVIHQVSIAGLLVGSSLSLTIVGAVLDIDALTWAWPVALGAMMFATKFVPWWRGDRSLEQLRRLRSDGDE